MATFFQTVTIDNVADGNDVHPSLGPETFPVSGTGTYTGQFPDDGDIVSVTLQWSDGITTFEQTFDATISNVSVSGRTFDWTLTVTNFTGLGLEEGAGTVTVISFAGQTPTSASFDVNYACFLEGTLILTPNGEVPIETLSPGDLIITADGQAAPVRWIGRQKVSARFADALQAFPVRISAGALGENVPLRDLYVSPCHAVFVDGVLLAARALVNGSSVVRITDVPPVFTYYHIELDRHDLVIADGAPAESFVDCVDRMIFDNWAERRAAGLPDAPIEEMPYPRAKGRRQVPMAIRRQLAERAAECGGIAAAA